jgi:phage-related protein
MSWVHQWPLSDIIGTPKRIILEVLFSYLDISLYMYHYVMQKKKKKTSKQSMNLEAIFTIAF